MLVSDKLTTAMALYGALLSTFGLGWTFHRDLRDKAKLKVNGGLKKMVQSEDGKIFSVSYKLADSIDNPKSELCIVFSAINVGRRPLTVEGCGGEYHKPKNGRTSFVILPHNLPKELKEGETVQEYTFEITPADDNVKRIFFYDTTGKKWPLPAKEFSKLKKDVKEISLSTGHSQQDWETG